MYESMFWLSYFVLLLFIYLLIIIIIIIFLFLFLQEQWFLLWHYIMHLVRGSNLSVVVKIL